MEVDQIIRSKRKTIALIVKPDGSLIVRAPWRASMVSISEFVQKNSKWIQKKQAEARLVVTPSPKQYAAGEMFMYLGNMYPLEIVTHQKSDLVLEADRFKLAECNVPEANRIFECWYREQARVILDERVHEFARRYGFSFKKIGITSARTRWGSCSATGALNFSWRLILAPMHIVDYVVVHELVHTQVHNHSIRFWKRVEQVMPDYKERRHWLRKNGQSLLF
jgi:predicted metal-dependent hydrolase